MAHSDGTPRHSKSITPRTPTTPTFEQLLQASSDGSRWSGPNSPSYLWEHDPEDHGHSYPKKSVLTKVKERARRWRQNLGKKKCIDQDGGTPSWGVGLEEDDGGEDAEYLGAPMYESELAPEDCKENLRQHPRANPVISENHVLPNSPRTGDALNKDGSMIPNKDSSTSPNKSMVESRSDQPYDNSSKMQNLSIGARPAAVNVNQGDAPVVSQNQPSMLQNTWDKGVSVKEYLMHKLEPGEDDRALSKAITDAMSPRKTKAANNNNNDVGIVDKVRDAVNSFLHTRESSSSSNAYLATHRAPISNSAHEVMEEESHGRILQAN